MSESNKRRKKVIIRNRDKEEKGGEKGREGRERERVAIEGNGLKEGRKEGRRGEEGAKAGDERKNGGKGRGKEGKKEGARKKGVCLCVCVCACDCRGKSVADDAEGERGREEEGGGRKKEEGKKKEGVKSPCVQSV